MRIAINSRLLIPGNLDGIGWFIYECICRLIAEHPEVEFHLLFDRKAPVGWISGKNVFLHRLLPPARRPFLFAWWLDYSIPRKLRQIGADLFISPDGLGSLRSHCPQLVVIHDINFERYPADLPQNYSRYLRASTRRLVKKATRLATVSAFSQKEIAEVYQLNSHEIDVIPNGVSEKYIPLSAQEKQEARDEFAGGDPYFIFISSIHPRKNLSRLLLAFDSFKEKQKSPFKLLIVGSEFWKNEHMRETQSSLCHKEDVIFTGRLDGERLLRALGGAHALAYISYYEGFGIPVVEAFRSGVPVLSSRSTAMEEVAGGAALLINPFSTNDVADGLFQLANDDTLCRQLIRKGLERATHFSWEKTAHLLWESALRTLGTKDSA